ncbi:MAG: peptidoglycan DD-metalloendopeptidase family protein [Maricaulaceae bacterium]
MTEFDPRTAGRWTWRRWSVATTLAFSLVAGLSSWPPSAQSDADTSKSEPVEATPIAAPQAPPPPASLSHLAETMFADANARSAERLTVKRATVRSGDTLGGMLARAGVSGRDAALAADALSEAFDPRELRIGQRLAIYLKRSALQPVATGGEGWTLAGLTLKPDVERTILVSQDAEGGFQVDAWKMDVFVEPARVAGTIQSSLYVDAGQAGARDRQIAEFVQLFSHAVDFQRSVQPGDAFELVFEQGVDRRGNVVRTGDLLFARFTPRGKELAFYRFETDENVEFFDATGESAKRFLMKTPIDGARISSGFGRRRHPILGFVKAHRGVDFAAPTGTPIYAAGSGVVEYAGWLGSAGKYIKLRHANGYHTAYMHLSKINVRKGQRVAQGATIGRVGTTGRSTGPHLHYEVHKKGVKVNPMALDLPTGRKLEASERPAFNAQKAEIYAIRKALIDQDAPVLVASAD